jgi:TPR repeat protein
MNAQYNLGLCYESGKVLDKNATKYLQISEVQNLNNVSRIETILLKEVENGNDLFSLMQFTDLARMQHYY